MSLKTVVKDQLNRLSDKMNSGEITFNSELAETIIPMMAKCLDTEDTQNIDIDEFLNDYEMFIEDIELIDQEKIHLIDLFEHARDIIESFCSEE